MFPVSLIYGFMYFISLVLVVSPQPSNSLPQQKKNETSNELLELVPYEAIEYNQIVPNDDYALSAVQPTELSISDYILSPAAAVISLGSTALSVVSWFIVKGGLIFLGMAIVIGFCALTPYCTLTIEKPSFLARENLSSLPYLEELEYYFNEAYNKYEEMQKSL